MRFSHALLFGICVSLSAGPNLAIACPRSSFPVTNTTTAPHKFRKIIQSKYQDWYNVDVHESEKGLVASIEIYVKNGAKYYSRPLTSWATPDSCAYWNFYFLEAATEPTVVWEYLLYKDGRTIYHYEIDARRMGVISQKPVWLPSHTWQDIDRSTFLPKGNQVFWDQETDQFFFIADNRIWLWEPKKQDTMKEITALPPRPLTKLSRY